MAVLFAAGAFVVAVVIVIALYYAGAGLPTALAERRIERRIQDVLVRVEDASLEEPSELVKRQAEGALPALDRLAANTGAGNWIARLIEQAGSRTGVSTVLLGSLGLGLGLGLLATAVVRHPAVLVPGFMLGAAIPFIVLLRRRSVRLRRFEEQFPEALDLLSRAIKAGHAFQTAMGMVAEEGGDPIGPEFRKTFEEQNFGLPLKDALNNLAVRVPLLDVRFFVTAVLIQRETGGNLSEILDNLAHVVRERFKILRQVRVYTAHGRLTGYVLLALPAFLAMALMVINPEHMGVLFTERIGQLMIAVTVVMQTVGYFWIRRIVKIEV